MMSLPGTASDELPQVLATGTTDVHSIFVSMAAREPQGRDAAYLEWHSLDHRPEQYRLAGLRHSLRLVSTSACRAARACSDPRYDAVDHVMTYFFAQNAALDQFNALSAALGGDRRPFRLPIVDAGYFKLVGKVAARRAIAGADVMPWRPALGVYLIVEQRVEQRVEQAALSPAALTDIAGVAGIWWHEGESCGLQLSYCFLDDDPVQTAQRLRQPLQQRWAAAQVAPLLAAPFYTIVPYEWERYLPGA